MPYMRVIRSRFDPAKAEDLERLREDFVAAFQQQPGLQHWHGGIDREGGRAVMVALFDTREQAEATPEALGPVNATLQSLGVQNESREIYEVTV